MSDVIHVDNNSQIVGAGGYGIVIRSHNCPQKSVYKLLYDMYASDKLKVESVIQQHLHNVFHTFLPEVKIPFTFHVRNEIVVYKQSHYLCGIEMEYLKPPAGFDEQVHVLLGYKGDDIDEEWGKQMALPVSESNPTRGFFASPDTMELIWKEENSSMTIERVAYLMGRALRLCIENGVLPIDVEWVWSNGFLYIIDFGLCEFGNVNAIEFLHKKGVRGLADDYYIPHEGDRGYNDFMRGDIYCDFIGCNHFSFFSASGASETFRGVSRK